MSFIDGEFDITKKIQMIEKLKSGLLSQVADLFASLSSDADDREDSSLDTLADIMILTYLLTNKLGISFEALDLKMLNKLKISILSSKDSDDWSEELTQLSRHLLKSRQL